MFYTMGGNPDCYRISEYLIFDIYNIVIFLI